MRNKMIVLTLAAIFIVAGVSFGQDSPLPIVSSLASDFSFGVFPNAMDNAAQVGGIGYQQEFGLDPNSYLFTGLGNINRVSTLGSRTASIGTPLWLGYYSGGDMPWSVFGGFSKEDALYDVGGGVLDPEPKSEISQTYGAPVTLVSGTTLTTYPVLATQTETQYETRLFKEISDGAQVIIGFPEFNLGLYLWLTRDNWDTGPAAGDNYGDNNYTEVVTSYYNTAIATEEPDVATDYTYTETSEEKRADTSIELAVPFYLPSGETEHYAELIVGLSSTDDSSSYTDTYTVPMDTATWGAAETQQSALAGFGLDTNNSVTDKTSGLEIGGKYRLASGGFFGENPENRFFAGGGLSFDTSMAEYAWSNETNDYTVTPGSATKTQDTKNRDTRDVVYSTSVGYSASANAGHSFFFDLGPAMFGFIPQIDVGLAGSNPSGAMVTSWTEVVRQDNDNDGAFTSAADNITTTERTYTNVGAINTANGNVTSDWTTVTDVTTEAAVPMAVKVQPGDWPFSFYLGSKPEMSMEYSISKTSSGAFSETVTNADGDGTVNSTAISEANTSVETTEKEVTWDFRVDHNAGVEVQFGDAVSLLVDISGAVAGGVWDFRSLVVQAVVAMP